MEDGIPEGTVVAIMAEGKQHALAMGMMKMSSDDIKKINKGIGVDVLTHLGDALWHTKL
jgi:malignant T-cell-amplified sequence